MTDHEARQVFLLSPASSAGKRARQLLRDGATFDLAVRLRSGGALLDEVFSFLSALYFRGKIAYARAFADPPARAPGILVITSSRGLIVPETTVTTSDLKEFAGVPIATDSRRYLSQLKRASHELAEKIGDHTRVVLLGSIATGKYVDPLREIFGKRLVFPTDFVGRGDMSRGGLMLRCAEDGRELDYVPVDDIPRHGPRPPKLAPRRLRTRTPGGA